MNFTVLMQQQRKLGFLFTFSIRGMWRGLLLIDHSYLECFAGMNISFRNGGCVEESIYGSESQLYRQLSVPYSAVGWYMHLKFILAAISFNISRHRPWYVVTPSVTILFINDPHWKAESQHKVYIRRHLVLYLTYYCNDLTASVLLSVIIASHEMRIDYDLLDVVTGLIMLL